jgi:hypothetical protein
MSGPGGSGRRADRRGKARAAALGLLLTGLPGATVGTIGMIGMVGTAAEAQTAAKSIEGKVIGGNSAPLPGAIVYLQDEKTNVIKTFIATKDGSYRFGQLPASTDYQIWAEYKGEKSKTRTISSFDAKLDVTYDFHLKGS